MLKKFKSLSGTSYLLIAALFLSLLGRYFDIFVLDIELTLGYFIYTFFAIISLSLLLFRSLDTEDYVAEFAYAVGMSYLIFTCYYVDLIYINTITQFFLIILLLRFQKNNFVYLHSFALVVAVGLCYYAYKSLFFTESKAIDWFLTTFCEWVFTFIVHKKIYKQHIDQLEEMKPLISIGRSTSFLLHELKGPLILLERDTPKEDKKKNQHIQEMKRLLEVSSSYANNRISHSFSSFDITLLIEKTLDLYGSQIKFLNIELERNYFDKVLTSDKTSLSIVLKNLIKNSLEAAIEYSGKPYSKITTEKVGSFFKVTIENPTNNKDIILSKIFTPGFTTKKGGANMGHGLYLSRKLIEDLSGTISVSLDDSIFVIELLVPSEEN